MNAKNHLFMYNASLTTRGLRAPGSPSLAEQGWDDKYTMHEPGEVARNDNSSCPCCKAKLEVGASGNFCPSSNKRNSDHGYWQEHHVDDDGDWLVFTCLRIRTVVVTSLGGTA